MAGVGQFRSRHLPASFPRLCHGKLYCAPLSVSRPHAGWRRWFLSPIWATPASHCLSPSVPAGRMAGPGRSDLPVAERKGDLVDPAGGAIGPASIPADAPLPAERPRAEERGPAAKLFGKGTLTSPPAAGTADGQRFSGRWVGVVDRFAPVGGQVPAGPVGDLRPGRHRVVCAGHGGALLRACWSGTYNTRRPPSLAPPGCSAFSRWSPTPGPTATNLLGGRARNPRRQRTASRSWRSWSRSTR